MVRNVVRNSPTHRARPPIRLVPRGLRRSGVQLTSAGADQSPWMPNPTKNRLSMRSIDISRRGATGRIRTCDLRFGQALDRTIFERGIG